MNHMTALKLKILHALEDLPPDSLSAVAEFVEFHRAKVARQLPESHPPRRVAKLGYLWQGYSFSEEDIRAARREAWAGLGKEFDA